MAEQIQISALIRPELDTGGIVKKISSIQTLLKKVNLPPSLQREFDGLFTDFNSSIEKINGQFSKGFETKGAVKSLDSMSAEMRGTVEKIAQAWQQVSSRGDLIKLPPDQDKKLKEINAEIQQLRTKINQVDPKNLEQVTQAIDQLKGKAGQKTGSEVMELIDQGEAQQAINLLDIIIAKREKMSLTTAESKSGDTFRADTLALTQMRDALLSAETETKDLVIQVERLDADGVKILTQAMAEMGEEIEKTGTDADSLNRGLEKTEGSMKKTAQGAQEMSKEMDEIKSRIKYFFSLSNAVQLVRQALRQTFESAKELDAAMTETAVVTDFSVGDMWDMLPEYTKTAQELGATTKGVYETLTLFYQQGLDTNEAMALGTETLKMARIAGMDYEEATSKMTAALRGFNMELDETSSKRVNDVYSELAAITAADTDQIATAMTKTASIANSANMEFETTAAFLSQIIETTQESAETAGTAMKTVIARFTELKKDPSLIGEVDGEVIDANKIETALNTIGVALRDNLTGQFRDLDDVFLDIAQKWEGLDTNTQRYIATIAAGSRQQSRFIAMMSDYERTMELVNAANDSAGSSQAQFDKTLESMEAKLNQLKNTWQEFTLGLMNQDILKAGIETLNKLVGVINKLTDLPGILGGASKALLSFFLMFSGKKLFGVFESMVTSQIQAFQSGGKTAAIEWGKAFELEFKKTKTTFQKNFKGLFTFPGKDGAVLSSFIRKGDVSEISKLSKETLETSYAFAKAQKSQSKLEDAMKSYGLTLEEMSNLDEAILFKGEREELLGLQATALADQKNLSQAAELANQTAIAKVYELSTDQLAEYNNIKSLGVSTDLAAAAAKAGVTTEQLREMAIKSLELPLDRELTEEEEKQVAVEMKKLLLSKQGIAVKLKEKVIKLGDIALTKLQTLAEKDNTAGKIASWLVQKLLNKEMLTGAIIIGSLVAVVALLVIGVMALVSAYQKQSKAGENATKTTQAAKKEAEEATQAYEDLKNSIEELDGLQKTLKGLEKGTADWKVTVAKLNQEILELIKNYPYLAEYVQNNDGVLSLNEEGAKKFLEQQSQIALNKTAEYNINVIVEEEVKSHGRMNYTEGTDSITKNIYDNLSIFSEIPSIVSGSFYSLEQELKFFHTPEELKRIYESFLQFQNGQKTFEEMTEEIKTILRDERSKTGALGADDLSNFTTQVISYLPELISVINPITESQNKNTEALIQNTNNMPENYADNQLNTATAYGLELFESKKESIVFSDNSSDFWAENYQSYLQGLDNTYTYDINDHGTTANISRTKGGVTEYLTDSGWSEDGEAKDITIDEAQLQVKNYQASNFTEEEIQEMEDFVSNIENLPKEAQAGIEQLIEDENYEKGELSQWFDEAGNTTAVFDQALERAKQAYGNLSVKAEQVEKQQNISKNEAATSAISVSLQGLSENGKIENEEELLGTLSQIDGLYSDLGTAAQEWAVVSQKGIAEQIYYLTELTALQIQQKQESINQAQFERNQLLQRKADIEDQLNKNAGSINYEIGLQAELKEIEKTLESTDWVLDIEVTDNFDEISSHFDGLSAGFDKITEAANLLSEGFIVSATDAQKLAEVFPGILKNAQVMTDGKLKLDEDIRTSVLDTAESEINSSIASTKEIIENEKIKLQAYIDAKTIELAVIEGALESENQAYAAALLVDLTNEGEFTQAIQKEEQTQVANYKNKLKTDEDNDVKYNKYRAEVNKQSFETINQIYQDDVENSAQAQKEKSGTILGGLKGVAAAIKTTFSGGTIEEIIAAFNSQFYDDGYSGGSIDVDPDDIGKDIDVEELTENFDPVYNEDGGLDYIATLDEYYNKGSAELEEKKRELAAYDGYIAILEGRAQDALNSLRNPGDSSSGSGSDSKDDSEYDAEYDENVKAKLNAAATKRLKLEEELQALMKDENATQEDILNKRSEILNAAKEELAILEEQNALDLAEVERLRQEHSEWTNLYTVDKNGATIWDNEAIKALNLSSEELKAFEDWKAKITKANENALNSSLDILEKTNEIKDMLVFIDNEFDELYNITAKMNNLVKERERLEIEYNRLLAKGVVNIGNLLEILGQQDKNLQEQAQAAQSEKEMAQIDLENFVNREENKKYSNLYERNEETGLYEPIIEEWEKLAAKGDEELYNAAKNFMDGMLDRQDKVVEAEEKQLEIEEERLKIAEEREEAGNQVEQIYYDALVEYMENQIEQVESLYSSIDESNSRILDAINKSLQDQREQRDNAKTEEDIADMRNKLAYLQMDTSGANQNEILNLQRQIQEKEEDYTDTLIDQKINELQEQNDYAAEQRERQITLLNDQHQQALKNGDYLEEAQRLAQDSLTGQEAIIKDIQTGNSNFNNIFPSGQNINEVINTNFKNEKMPTPVELEESQNELLELIAKGQKGIEERQRNFRARDSYFVNQLISGSEDINKLSAFEFAVYDVDGNGEINAADAEAILRIAVGLPSGIKGKKFATGGLADYTGPAWLDGTKSRPELVLNQQDTQNFLRLKDILSQFMSNNNFKGNSSENSGDNYYEIHLNVEKITSDYDVEQLANKVKSIIAEDANSRGVNSIYRRR